MPADLAQLRRCLQALARPAGEQVASFPDFVCVGDELVLDLDDALRNAGREGHGPEPDGALRALDDYISALSGPPNEAFWLEERPLFEDQRWERIRALAKTALASFGWPDEAPPGNGAIYVRGQRVKRAQC